MDDDNVIEITEAGEAEENIFKRTGTRVKNFVVRNKNTLIVGGIGTAVILLQSRGLKSAHAFIDEHGLTEEYLGELGYETDASDDNEEIAG